LRKAVCVWSGELGGNRLRLRSGIAATCRHMRQHADPLPLICLLAASADSLDDFQELILDFVELVDGLAGLRVLKVCAAIEEPFQRDPARRTTCSNASSMPSSASASGFSTSILAVAAPVFTPSCHGPQYLVIWVSNYPGLQGLQREIAHSPAGSRLAPQFHWPLSSVLRLHRVSAVAWSPPLVHEALLDHPPRIVVIGGLKCGGCLCSAREFFRHPALAFTYRPGAGSMTEYRLLPRIARAAMRLPLYRASHPLQSGHQLPGTLVAESSHPSASPLRLPPVQ
jgi:hypothetical protein